jgi:putative Holliday junction resolvase
MRVLGLDVGEKRIGAAISDPLQRIAFGLKVYKRKSIQEDMGELRAIVETYEVEKIIVGLPKDLKGRLGERAKDVLRYKQVIEEELGLPVILWDERFTTNEAHRVFDLFGVNAKRRKRYLDATSAQIILQGFLDAQAH